MTLKINNKIILYFIPFLIGLIISFSLPPYNYLIINFILFPIIFIFFVANYNRDKWRSLKIGWLFGFGYFVSSIYWITNSLTFDDQFKNLIPFAFVIIPIFLGLFYGFITFFCSFFNLKNNFSSILIFATIFSSIEFVRSFILGGFPWNLSVYSWTNYLNFLQILPFIGTYSFNLLSITVFLVPSVFFSKYNTKLKLLTVFCLIFLISINYFYGSVVIKNYNQTDYKKTSSIIKIVSPRIEIDRFFNNEDPSEMITELIELSNPNFEKETIFIFPEGVLTSIYLEDLKNYKKIFSDNYSSKHKIILGISSIENSKIFNSLVVIDKNANILSQYNKNNLVPFGEFLPFENFLSNFGIKKITAGYQSFSEGINRQVLNINNIKFLPLICYEIIYSGRLNKNHEHFDFIINISEDGWFGDSIGPHQHFSHSIFRAIEEGKNLIRSANNGTAAFIDSTGQVIDSIESTQKGVIELNQFRGNKKTIFSSLGNKLFFYFISFYIILIFFLKKIWIKGS